MANNQIPQLSLYQFGLLCHTAVASVPIFLLPKPVQADSPSQRYKLIARGNEIKSLIAMGLMEDASEEFKENVQEHIVRTGRRFKVYGLTEIGHILFRDCETRPAN